MILLRTVRIYGTLQHILTHSTNIGTPKGVGPVEVGDRMIAGIEVMGREIEEGKIDVYVADKGGRYMFEET